MNSTIWNSLEPLDTALRATGYFNQAYRLVYKRTARGEVYWLEPNGDYLNVTLLDHVGPYFYIRSDGPLRVENTDYFASCGVPLPYKMPLVLVAWIEKKRNPYCVHSNLNTVLSSIPNVEILETEIDTLRIFWNEHDSAKLDQEPNSPVNTQFHALSWKLSLKVDLAINRCEFDECCEPIDYCVDIDQTI